MEQDVQAGALEGVKIAWMLPRIEPGSGGQQTVFRHVTHLQKLGAECHVLTCQFGIADNAKAMMQILSDSYQCVPDKLFDTPYSDEQYDLAIATMNTTVPYLMELDAREHAYFVQDYEPFFYPVNEQYISALSTYQKGLNAITIGRWLVHKLTQDHGLKARYTEFTADRSLYRPLGRQRKKAVCAVFQPSKPRRCYELVAKTLELVHAIDPEIEVVLYGQDTDYPFTFPVDNRGLVSKEECNELYNECMVGLCISATNPSRVPFEMMAAGLPVVDIYADNMLWDFPPSSAVLAEPNPAALATAILSLAEDSERCRLASQAGIAFMESRDSREEQAAMARIVTSLIKDGDEWKGDDVDLMYTAKPVVAPQEIQDVFRLTNRVNLDGALTVPALECSSQYVRIGVSGLPDGMLPIDVFFNVWPDFKADVSFMRYNVRGIEDGECWAQINFGDFGNQPGLYHCQALCASIDPFMNQCIIECSFRLVPADEDGPRPGALRATRGTFVMTATTSDKPLAFSVKSAVKETLPEPAVEALRSLFYKLR